MLQQNTSIYFKKILEYVSVCFGKKGNEILNYVSICVIKKRLKMLNNKFIET